MKSAVISQSEQSLKQKNLNWRAAITNIYNFKTISLFPQIRLSYLLPEHLVCPQQSKPWDYSPQMTACTVQTRPDVVSLPLCHLCKVLRWVYIEWGCPSLCDTVPYPSGYRLVCWSSPDPKCKCTETQTTLFNRKDEIYIWFLFI